MATTSTIFMRIAIIGLVVLFVALIARTAYFSHPPHPVQHCKPTDSDFISLNHVRLKHFQEALQFKTVSQEVGVYEREELEKYGNYIINNFPFLHKRSPHVEWERVNNYSFLYHIKGSNPSLKPYLLMGHLDVVPVVDLEMWEAQPFSGEVRNGYIYGRGAIDNKQSIMGILEATEYMLEHNTRPVRSFYIGFGHDEEVSGQDGASQIVKRLQQQGVTNFEYILDEGMPITDGIITGVKKPVAGIAVTEKGQAYIKFSVASPPGHSSMPPKESSIGILSRAISRLESTPFPSMLGNGVEMSMFEQLVPEMNIFLRVFMANIWLFNSAISWFMSLKPSTASLIKTITGVTMFNAGIKVNVIPPHAEAVVNHRIHPSQSVQEVVEYDRSVIADDRVKMEVIYSMEPHPVAGYGETDFGYQVIKTSLRQVWSDIVAVPTTCVGNTDTRHYLNFTHNIYRFSPTYMFSDDLARFHGNNERISVKNYEQVINYFYHLIRNSDSAAVEPTHQPHDDL